MIVICTRKPKRALCMFKNTKLPFLPELTTEVQRRS